MPLLHTAFQNVLALFCQKKRVVEKDETLALTLVASFREPWILIWDYSLTHQCWVHQVFGHKTNTNICDQNKNERKIFLSKSATTISFSSIIKVSGVAVKVAVRTHSFLFLRRLKKQHTRVAGEPAIVSSATALPGMMTPIESLATCSVAMTTAGSRRHGINRRQREENRGFHSNCYITAQ